MSSHKRNWSTDSDSEAAASQYTNSDFQKTIHSVISSPTTLDLLVAQAEAAINNFVLLNESTMVVKEKSIQLDRVMSAMMAHAEEAGGESGKRYVASVIIACNEEPAKLAAVGHTWLTHLLFVFKSSHGHRNQTNTSPSPIVTPTVDNTRAVLDSCAGNRVASFKDDLLLRDGYQCPVMGLQDNSHPHPTNMNLINLKGCHILRRAIATFGNDIHSKSNVSATATLDILLNYTHLSNAQVTNLSTIIDDPSNGMLLESNIHEQFDNFDWCLQPTQIPNFYTVKSFTGRGPILFSRSDPDAPVIFEDKSSRFPSPADARKWSRSIPLPDPNLIAIHAAIAGILNMSGAGKFFDELLDKYRDRDDLTPLLRWLDVENMFATEMMREMLQTSLARVHFGV